MCPATGQAKHFSLRNGCPDTGQVIHKITLSCPEPGQVLLFACPESGQPNKFQGVLYLFHSSQNS